jgi:hypothetical protein
LSISVSRRLILKTNPWLWENACSPGELTSFTNHWNAQVTYGYDKAGGLTNVGGAGYAGVSNYASSLIYRAFGGIKGMSYRKWPLAQRQLLQAFATHHLECRERAGL